MHYCIGFGLGLFAAIVLIAVGRAARRRMFEAIWRCFGED